MHEQTGPRPYRIVVRGRLGEPLAAGFGEFELAFKAGQSSLTGSLQDQVQLHGLLDRLRDLGIPFISVKPVE
jgi:hypothetical protein